MNYKVPYEFILRFLYPVRPKIRKMFGSYVLAKDMQILFLLRDQAKQPEYNGVFVATQPQYYDELLCEIHASNMEVDIDGVAHSWLFISEDLDDFEKKLKAACDLLKAGDTRIGKEVGKI